MAMHQTTFIPCPDGSGVMPHPLALDPISQAQCRVYQQDRPVIEGAFRQNAIPFSMQQIMLAHLSFYCQNGSLSGAPFALSEGHLTNMGTWLLQQYKALSMEEQVTWLRADLQVREAILTKDEHILKLHHDSNAARNGSTVTAQDTDYIIAIQQRLQINVPQINHLRQCEGRLIALIAARELSRQAPPIEPVLPVQAPVTSAAVRVPLAPVSANMAPKAQPRPDSSLKRKRLDAQPKKASEVIEVLDDSEDEDQLQDKLEAIQAKIAAIRSRTGNEDQMMPSKKAKTGRKSEGEAKPVAQQNSMATVGQTSSRPTSVVHDPYVPPRSSQMSQVPCSSGTFTSSSQPWAVRAMAETTSASRRTAPGPIKTAPKNQVHPSSAAAVRYESVAKSPAASSATRKSPHVPGTQAARQQQVVDLTSSSPSPSQVTLPVSTSTDGPVLCREQQEVVNLIMAGHNVFYTGSAGCGKSTVLKTFVPRLRDKGKVVRIVAPTGKAALDINGSTTWTYAGWTPLHMKKPLSDLKKAAHGKFVGNRLRGTDVLVIDEISMVENHMLARLDAIMKEARGNDNAFGGVQLIVTGDFCQLPPVKPFQYCMLCGREQAQKILADGRTVHRCFQHGDSNDDDKWAFRSTVWEDCKFKHIDLTNIHRQSDEVFIKILQKLRIGTELTTAD